MRTPRVGLCGRASSTGCCTLSAGQRRWPSGHHGGGVQPRQQQLGDPGAPAVARGLLNGAGTINGVLYVAGRPGLERGGDQDLFAYNPSTNTWTARAPMLKAGACGASGVIDGKLYVLHRLYQARRHSSATIRRPTPGRPWRHPGPPLTPPEYRWEVLCGGRGQTEVISSRKSWRSTIRPRTPGRSGPDADCARGRRGSRDRRPLVRVGGTRRQPPGATVEVYDPGARPGIPGRSMPTPRVDLASGALNGKLYVVGGYAGATESWRPNEVYTPGDVWLAKAARRPRWRPSPPPSWAENSTASAAGSTGVASRQNLVYDPGTNGWTSRALLPAARMASNGAGVINGIVYVPGGHSGDGIPTKACTPTIRRPTPGAPRRVCRRPSAAVGAACLGQAVRLRHLWTRRRAGRVVCLRPGDQQLGEPDHLPDPEVPRDGGGERQALPGGRPGRRGPAHASRERV